LSLTSFLHLVQVIHVEVSISLEPVLACLDSQHAKEAQAAVFVGEDAQDDGPALDLTVQALDLIRRVQLERVEDGWNREGFPFR